MTRITADTRSTTESYNEIVARLAGAQKKRAPGAPAYSIYVNRKAGRYLAAGAYKVGLTPNVVTAISALFTFAGIAMLAILPPAWWVGVAIWLALAIGYAFDSADGQVARLRGGGSASGEWLDHVVDATKISTLHLAVLIMVFRHFDFTNPALYLIPMGYTVVAAVSFFAMILNDQLKAAYGHKPALDARRSSPMRSLLVIPTDYGFLCMIFLLIGFPPLFFAAYTLMFIANTGHLLLGSVKWFRDMDRLGAAPAADVRS
ncbi:CDP-alcohol phosphatidyltransferase family protein [Plantibacter sp. ME-Dv--P-095]|uniref:CDP-alcohol phosphatidyltransferase family protein n=1 Tax=Plantibacter sp. ME-Dv--P-095 TaxID=3040299 RepID=UPI002549CCC6|nr:CDP-alcohol phosphatidyltransferase family protein [Plantibacter sp. ME-Dv--P-095]